MQKNNIRVPLPLDVVSGGAYQSQSIALLTKGRVGKHTTQAICFVRLARVLQNIPNNLYAANQDALFLQQKRDWMKFGLARPISQAALTREQFRPFYAYKRENLAF